jgi:hypothetical protein
MRRIFALVATAVLIAGDVLASAPPSMAAASCIVHNRTSGAVHRGGGANLQAAIDEASSGDTLAIRGICVGRFRIEATDQTYELTLLGVSTDGFPTPTLDAARHGRVLSIQRATVSIADLTITRGAHVARGWGGGIWLNRGSLTLSGTTAVRRNRANYGGGIYAYDGSILLGGSATIRGNRGGGINAMSTNVTLGSSSSIVANRDASAGGVAIKDGTLTLHDSSSIRRNRNWLFGGGAVHMYARASVVMDGSTRIVGNTATTKAGGIFVHTKKGTVFLYDDASITGNQAGKVGGGVYVPSTGKVYLCSPGVRISPNDPDDPPPTLPCP